MPRPALVPAFLIVCSIPAFATLTECPQHYAGGRPPVIDKPSLRPRTQELCFRAFAVLHSGVSRGPLWAAEHLRRAEVQAAEDMVRKDAFHAEPKLAPADRAELADYARSGYDRGHMAPSGDMPSGPAQAESFSLANMVPQVHTNNAGIWADIEGATRRLALEEGDLYVVTGPAFVGSRVTRLNGRVLVPTHLWKVLYSPRRGQAGAYLVSNDDTRDYTAISVSDLQRMIGIQPLPGVSRQARDELMALPAPKRSRDAGQPRNKRPPPPEPAAYSLRELALQAISRLWRTLAK